MRELEVKGYVLYSTDGYTHQEIAVFSNLRAAETILETMKDRAYHGIGEKRIFVRIYDTAEEYDEQCRKTLRERALAKLSDAERKELGV